MELSPSIADYQDYLSSHPGGCEETVRHYLDRIEANRHLNAYLEVFAEEALVRARNLDRARASGKPRGKLHGVVVAIKDVIAYKGHRLSAASRMLEGFTSLFDSTAVQRLLKAEAIVIGRTNCDEFAMGSTTEHSAFGPVRNAQDPTRVPGGSSGGSAVAVQADLCMISLGSDTGGSVRQPADFCGVVGYKPTYGVISRHGLVAYASSFDQIGIFGKVVADIALALSVLSGPDEFDATACPNPLEINIYPTPAEETVPRVAYFKEAFEHPSLDPEIRRILGSFIDRLQQDGVIVEAVPFGYLDYIVPAYYVLTTAEASSNLSRYDGVRYGHKPVQGAASGSRNSAGLDAFFRRNRTQGFGNEVKRRILLGTFVLSAGHYDAFFTKAQQVRRMLVDKTDEVFRRYDALLFPGAPGTAWTLGEKADDPIAVYLSDIYTVFANLVGVPGISLPLFQHPNGMPFGLQLLGDRFRDGALLQLGNQWLFGYKGFPCTDG